MERREFLAVSGPLGAGALPLSLSSRSWIGLLPRTVKTAERDFYDLMEADVGSVIPLADGGFAMSGTVHQPRDSPEWQFALGRFDETLQRRWRRTVPIPFDPSPENEDEAVFQVEDLVRTDDGGFVLGGRMYENAVIKTGPAGHEEWSVVPPVDGDLEGVVQADDGSILVATSEDVLKYTPDGDLVWTVPTPNPWAVFPRSTGCGIVARFTRRSVRVFDVDGEGGVGFVRTADSFPSEEWTVVRDPTGGFATVAVDTGRPPSLVLRRYGESGSERRRTRLQFPFETPEDEIPEPEWSNHSITTVPANNGGLLVRVRPLYRVPTWFFRLDADDTLRWHRSMSTEWAQPGAVTDDRFTVRSDFSEHSPTVSLFEERDGSRLDAVLALLLGGAATAGALPALGRWADADD
jgi:hypothetical protein